MWSRFCTLESPEFHKIDVKNLVHEDTRGDIGPTMKRGSQVGSGGFCKILFDKKKENVICGVKSVLLNDLNSRPLTSKNLALSRYTPGEI